MLLKTLLATAVLTAATATTAYAGPNSGPGNKLNKIDKKLDRLERNGHIEQGSRLDKFEDRIDRREDRIDRREDKRDLAVNNGPRDRFEDRVDRRESRRDRRENKRDRLDLK